MNNTFQEYIKLNEDLQTIALVSTAGALLIKELFTLFRFYTHYIDQLVERKDLERDIQKILSKANISAKKFYIYESDDIGDNAFLCPAGVIIFGSELENKFNKKQLLALLLHEYAHYKNNDEKHTMIRENSIIAIAVGVAMAVSNIFVSLFVFYMINKYGKSVAASAVKYKEFNADDFVVKVGYGEYLQQVFEIWSDEYEPVSDVKVVGIIDKINEILVSHPTFHGRIKNIIAKIELYRKPTTLKALEKQIIGGVYERN